MNVAIRCANMVKRMTNKESATVIIDSREKDENLISTVSNHDEVSTWFIDNLEAGDLLVNDSVRIERKTVSDWASSVLEDRIREQAEKLSNTEDFSFVFIEGDMADFHGLQHTEISPKSLRGCMASISIRYGIPVVPVGSMENLVDLAVRMGRKAIEDPSTATIKSGDSPSKDAPQTVRILSSIEGIGDEVSWNLYSEFGSVEKVIAASIDELIEVPLVGEARAVTIFYALRDQGEQGHETQPCGNHHPLPCGLDEACPVPSDYFNAEKNSKEIHRSWVNQ